VKNDPNLNPHSSSGKIVKATNSFIESAVSLNNVIMTVIDVRIQRDSEHEVWMVDGAEPRRIARVFKKTSVSQKVKCGFVEVVL